MTKKKFNIIFFSGILFFFLILIVLERKSNNNNNQYVNLQNNLIIATYIDGKFSDNMPSKESGYDVDKIECNKDINVKWDYNKWSFAFLDNLSEVRCNIYFKVKTVYEYGHTGDEQTFTVPLTGVYKLETWGAAGGSISLKGGNGAYSKGYISLNKDDILYVNVGGTTNNGTGGYNGGGTVTNNRYGGGGATHIATKSGLLNKFENNQDDILIVSGGGGGEGNGFVGGSGGGIGRGNEPLFVHGAAHLPHRRPDPLLVMVMIREKLVPKLPAAPIMVTAVVAKEHLARVVLAHGILKVLVAAVVDIMVAHQVAVISTMVPVAVVQAILVTIY